MAEKEGKNSGIVEAKFRLQALVRPVVKADANPFHKSKYATIDNIWTAISKPMEEVGLIFDSKVVSDDGKFYLLSLLTHVNSGQFESTVWPLKVDFEDSKKNANQEIGAAITYGRRYSLICLLNLTFVEEDNDGNNEEQRSQAKAAQPAPKPSPTPTAAVKPRRVFSYMLNSSEDLSTVMRGLKTGHTRLKYDAKTRRYVGFSKVEIKFPPSSPTRSLQEQITWEKVEEIADKVVDINPLQAVQLWEKFCAEPEDTAPEDMEAVLDELFDGVK